MNIKTEPIEVTGIWLRHGLGELEVLAEIDGQWRSVILEHIHDPKDPISHIVEPAGMKKAVAPEWLAAAAPQVPQEGKDD